MKVAMIGFGAMGAHMAGHIAASGRHQVMGYDINPDSLKDAPARGIAVATSLGEVAAFAEVVVVMVATDDQARAAIGEMLAAGASGALFCVAATLHPDTVKQLATDAEASGCALIDCPVVFGLSGARDGELVSLCGGSADNIQRAEDVLLCYSRKLYPMGPVGSGMLTKTVNNLLHWSACVANFEAIALGKRYGLNGQHLREVLLDCPATNGTLKDWDETRLTWPVKDMAIALDLAQQGDLVMPLYGQVDQLVRLIKPEQIKGLLHQDKTHYLGREIRARDDSE